MYGKASELYNGYPEIYFNEYKALLQMLKKRKVGNKYDPVSLFLETYNFWFENEKWTASVRCKMSELQEKSSFVLT